MIRIGPAGSGGLGNLKGVRRVAELNLDCMEVEFTYGVRLGLDAARDVGKLARQYGIVLSVHAPYYVNLAADEDEKVAASKKRILDSCERADALGAQNVVFHAGFYQKKTAEQTYRLIKEAICELQSEISENKWQIALCPETPGKPSQFGSLEEILRLMRETGCGITVDFSHLYARRQGKMDWGKLLAKLPENFHAHFSGIEFGEKGEKKHIRTTEAFFKPLAQALIKQKKINITLISESPKPQEDAAMMKRVLNRLQN